MFARLLLQIGALIVALPLVLAPALAKDIEFTKEELDQLLAPIALYPDDVLSNVLMASTYPLEVVQAARWIKEPANAKLKEDALTKALEKQDWDPSVKSLTPFPEVLEMMSDELEWMQKVGDAVLAQEADVMDQIQLLRDKADEAGNLKSNEQQKVSKKSSGGSKYIYIEPASPDVVYVPVYEPTVVYGSWWYPAYPPYYWPPPRGGAFVAGFFWGVGVATPSSHPCGAGAAATGAAATSISTSTNTIGSTSTSQRSPRTDGSTTPTTAAASNITTTRCDRSMPNMTFEPARKSGSTIAVTVASEC